MKQDIRIHDVTLRDGNQALRKPWNAEEKQEIFRLLLRLGVQGIEIGFPSSNAEDFNACSRLAQKAPLGVTISALSRAVEKEIKTTWEAIRNAPLPRLHIVYPISAFSMANVIRKTETEVLQKIQDSIGYAKHLVGNQGEIQFSGEHFGDPETNLEFAKEAFQLAERMGANVINLANTVERERPLVFVSKVAEIRKILKPSTILSVHTHNDLGMATACAVESVFAGANQVEVALNGLGERSGNTNLYETALGLHFSGKQVQIHFSEIDFVSKEVARLSQIPIPEKAPIIGEDIFSHRSGIHQDGVLKTLDLDKGAYQTFRPQFIGRNQKERIEFTNQSGKTALRHVIQEKGVSLETEVIETLWRREKGSKFQ